MESTAYLQPTGKVKENPDTEYTRSMRRQFPLFGIGCFLYSAFYAFCLYKNASGITYPFFVAGTLCCFFFSMKKLGVPFKKSGIFYMTGMILLGISNCMTVSPQILMMNKCGIFFLSLILMLHTVYDDKTWDFSKYFSAVFRTAGSFFGCLFSLSPFGDMISYFDAQKQEKPAKKNYFLPALIGLVIAIPLLFFMTLLLTSADAVFENMLSSLIDVQNILNVVEICILMAVVFFSSYAILSALCKKEVNEKIEEKKRFDAVIAIVITSLLCLLYMAFSMVQIVYLFIGNMELPENYTYADYAREGFFQLLVVSIINFLLVLLCLRLFQESKTLRIILTMICGCTFIMIFSSALRMLLYIDSYFLTFLRLFVLWALAVIFLLMAGVTVSVFYRQFPLFFYGLSVITVCYIFLSFSHPDYLVARYNLANSCNMELPAAEEPPIANASGTYGANYYDFDYLSSLSADAAPAILNQDTNPYFINFINLKNMQEKTAADEYDGFYADYLYRINDFYHRMEYRTEAMGIRDFNFSLYRAKKYIDE